MELTKKYIKDFLGSTIYSRALSYHRDGRVLEIHHEFNKIQAVVRGSGRNLYQVEIDLKKNGAINEAYCNCPYPYYCKHIGAVLFEYINKDVNSIENDYNSIESFLSENKKVEKKSINNEIIQLTDTGKVAHPIFEQLELQNNFIDPPKNSVKESKGKFRLIFIIEKKWSGYYLYSSNIQRWFLKTALQYIKMDGEFGRIEKYNPAKLSFPISEKESLLISILKKYNDNTAPFEYFIDYFLSSNIDLITNDPDIKNIDKKRHDHNPLNVEMDKDQRALSIYIKTNRNFNKLTLIKIRKSVIRFRFFSLISNRGNEPLFKPVVYFYDNEGNVTNISAPYLVDFSGKVFFIVDEDGKKLLYQKENLKYANFLSKLLSLSNGYTYSDIIKMKEIVEKVYPNLISVEFPTKEVRIVNIQPKTILTLRDVYEGLEIAVMFKYKFAYDDNKIQTQQERDPEFIDKTDDLNKRVLKKTSYVRVISSSLKSDILILNKEEDGSAEETLIAWRDKEYERIILSYIQKIFENDIDFYHGRNKERHSIWDYKWQNEEHQETIVINKDIDEFLLKYGERLLSEGFELRKDGKKVASVLKVIFTANWGIDWLDIKTEFQSEDGATLAFNSETDVIEGNFLKSKDTYILLNKKHLEKLKSLYQHGIKKKDSIQISKYDVSIIDELYQDLKNKEEKNIKKIKKVIDGLKMFDGIKNVKLPSTFSGFLREYQQAGLNWLYFLNKYKLNGILADDMGLGKTIQALALILTLKTKKNFERALIVAPVSTLTNWISEIKRFTPSLTANMYHGPSRKDDMNKILLNDIVVTSYGTLRNDIAILTKHNFTYLILDEAQVVKNPISKSYKSVKLINAENRLCLTGTPVENSTIDLWAQINLLNPGLLGTLTDFKKKFAKPIEKDHEPSRSELLKKIVFPFILRRKKEDVLKELPPKEEITLYATMDKKQKKVYEEIRSFYKSKVQDKIKNKGLNRASITIFEALLKLRQAAILPSLISEKYKLVPSCKLDILKLKIDEVLSESHKALIFSQFRGSLSEIRSWIKGLNVGYSYLDGSTRDREKQINEFQEDENKKIFIISLRAGGLGINLTASNYVFLFDPWWNPAVEMQAVDRSHRIGQSNKVTIYKLITRNTVEEKILLLQQKKRNLVNDIISTEKAFFKSLNKEEIMDLFDSTS